MCRPLGTRLNADRRTARGACLLLLVICAPENALDICKTGMLKPPGPKVGLNPDRVPCPSPLVFIMADFRTHICVSTVAGGFMGWPVIKLAFPGKVA
jgi:hypothetical protein